MHALGKAFVAYLVASLVSPTPAGALPRGYVYDTIEWRTADSDVVATGRIWAVVHNDVREALGVDWDTISFEIQDTFKGSAPRLIQFRVRDDKSLDRWKGDGTLLLVFLAESWRFHSRAASLFQYAPHTGSIGGSFIDLSVNSGAAVFTEHDGFVSGPAAILRHEWQAVQETKGLKYTLGKTQVALITGVGGPGGYTVEPHSDSADPEIGPVVRFDSTAEFDGRTIAAVQDKVIKLWSAETGELIRTFGPSDDPMLSVAVSPDGEHIVGGSGSVPYPGTSKDNHLRVWARNTGALENQTPTHGPISGITFVNQDMPGGGRIVTTSSEDYSGEQSWRQRLWDTWNLDDYMIFPGAEPRISPDGSMVLTIDRSGWIGVWDSTTFLQLCTIPGDVPFGKDFHSAEFSPYGNRIVTSSTLFVGLKQGYESDIDVWDAETGKHIFAIVGSRISDAIYTHDGANIVTGSRDGVISVYNAEDGKLERSIKLSGKVYQMLVSPDGTRCLVKWGPDSFITKADNAGLIDISTGKELMHLNGDVSGLVGFSRDSKTLFGFGSGNTTGTVWDSETGAVVRTLTLQ